MAKCIRNPKSKEVKRVSDDEAQALVNKGWKYISKSEYRAALKKAES